jgi:hypothetical protein
MGQERQINLQVWDTKDVPIVHEKNVAAGRQLTLLPSFHDKGSLSALY